MKINKEPQNFLNTPFGEIKISIDDKDYPFYAIFEHKGKTGIFPDVLGCYRIVVDFKTDGLEHEIKCYIPEMKYVESSPESGEDLECQSFYDENGMKISFGAEGESGSLPDGSRFSDRYDYDVNYLKNGISYVLGKESQGNRYVFGIAWIDGATDNPERDIQTWFAADVTLSK